MTMLLIVEDNEMNADMLIRRLKRQGFEAAWARTGLEAVAMAAELRPDLILMDLSLPELDGFATTRMIKAGPAADVPVIALTAHVMIEDERKALAAGCVDYETKPVNFAQLLSKIRLHLGETPNQ